jgi:hypothetical protein
MALKKCPSAAPSRAFLRALRGLRRGASPARAECDNAPAAVAAAAAAAPQPPMFQSRIPKAQAGVNLSLFRAQNTALFEAVARQYKSRDMAFAIPDHLRFYATAALDFDVVQAHCRTVVLYSAYRAVQSDQKTVFLFTPSDRDAINAILGLLPKIPHYAKVILVVPRQTAVLAQVLAAHRYAVAAHPPAAPGEIAIHDFPADLLQVEPDFFLMPCCNAFRRYCVCADLDDLFVTARVIVKLQKYFGKIPHVVSVGSAAHSISDLLAQFDADIAQSTLIPQIDSLIIFDRAVDLITPITSQVNMEGVLSTVFSKQYGLIRESEDTAYRFTEANEGCRTVRMLSIPGFLRFRREFREIVNARTEELKNGVAATAHDIHLKTYQGQLNDLEALVTRALDAIEKRSRHYSAIIGAESRLLHSGNDIQPFVENLILIDEDWRTALRLLALQSAVNGGLRNVRQIQAEILAEFGTQAQDAILDLERVGYLSTDGLPLPFKRSLLFVEADDIGEPTDPIGTALGGFAPPSVRIVRAILGGESLPKKLSVKTRGERIARDDGETVKVLVFFVGGVTATEVGALRNVARQALRGTVEIIVGSTDQITADSFLEQFCPFLREHTGAG